MKSPSNEKLNKMENWIRSLLTEAIEGVTDINYIGVQQETNRILELFGEIEIQYTKTNL